MKQVLRKGLKDVVVEEVPDPVAGPHQVLVRPVSSLISSGTETASIHHQGVMKEVAENPSHLLKIWEVMKIQGPARTMGEVLAKFEEYAVLGYAGAGVVVDHHPTTRGVEVGMRVAYGGEGTGHAEYVVTGKNLVARLPDAVSFEHGCFTTLGSIALNAVRIARLELGDTVAVIGLGLVGQLTAQMARLQGARVIAIDLLKPRTALALELGADHAVTGPSSINEAVAGLTNGIGVDCALVAAASKSASPCHQALSICRDRGRIVVVGAVELSFPWLEMYLKEVQLFMARAYGPGSYDPDYEQRGRDYPLPYVRWTEQRNMEEFLRTLDGGRVDVEPLITHRFPLEDAPAAYDTIMDPGSPSLAVLLTYPKAATAPHPAQRVPQRTTQITAKRSVPTSAELRFALLGAGNIARWAHLSSLKSIRGASLHAVYSASGARGKSYARRFGAQYCSNDLDHILGDPAVDAVIIASRNHLHAAQAQAALDAGKHVFVEKPMAITEDECRSIMEATAASGRLLTVGFNRRFAPDYQALRDRLAGRQGPAQLNCRVNSPGISGSYWMADPAIGGAILGEAVHFVDLFYWLLGSEPCGVFAYSLPRDTEEPVGQNNLAASFQFTDGSIANLTYGTMGTKSSAGERLEAFGLGIAICTEDFRRVKDFSAIRRSKTRWFPAKGYAAQLQSFASRIRAGEEPLVTALDGARATIACLRMLDSAMEGRPFPIDVPAVLSGQRRA